MKVTLSNGDEIEIIGPVVKETEEGVFISHREFNAKVNGDSRIISADDLVDATFPDDVAEQVQKAFEATLPEVERAWKKLNKFWATRGEKA